MVIIFQERASWIVKLRYDHDLAVAELSEIIQAVDEFELAIQFASLSMCLEAEMYLRKDGIVVEAFASAYLSISGEVLQGKSRADELTI